MSKSTVLLSSVTETPLPEESWGGAQVTRISVAGDQHVKAVIDALVDAYPRPNLVRDEVLWRAIARDRAKVSITVYSENMFGAPIIAAQEGTLFLGSGDAVAMLPKGARSKGYRMPATKVLDVELGYGYTARLAERLNAVRSRFPRLRELTPERLRALPEHALEDPTMLTLAVFGRWMLPDGGALDALYLAHSYMREDDIIEGYLFVPDAVGESEHGSCYGAQLLSMGGEVENFQPMPLEQAFEMSHSEALAYVTRAIR